MQNTTNYSLPTWERDDQIKMSDFNAMTAKLDAALKSSADALASEVTARESALTAEASARESAVAAETAARQGALAAVAKNLGAAGHNARIAWGSYTGTGKYGADNPTALTFGFCPVLVFIAEVSPSTPKNPIVLIRGRSAASSIPEGASSYRMSVTWTDSGVSWYNATSCYNQLNNTTQYCYAVLGYDKAAEEA